MPCQVEEFMSAGSLDNFLRVTDTSDLDFLTLVKLVTNIAAGSTRSRRRPRTRYDAVQRSA